MNIVMTNYIKTFLALTVLLLSQITKAEPVALTCVKNGGNFTYVVEFDEVAQTAKTNFGVSVAKFTESEIIFSAITKEGISYLHIVNRSNGNLSIFNETTGKFISPYTCNKTVKKF